MTEPHDSANVEAGNPSGDNDLRVGAPVRVGRLSDLKTMRAEVGRLYREARRREGRYPDALTAQRLANVLGHVRTVMEIELLEQRLSALEDRERARRG